MTTPVIPSVFAHPAGGPATLGAPPPPAGLSAPTFRASALIRPATCAPPDLRGRYLSSARDTWSAVVDGMAAYWTSAIAKGSNPVQVGSDITRWSELMNDRRPPTWASPNEVMWTTPIARLRDFTQGARDQVVPTLVLPPQAGHDSCIVDYSELQSQIKVIRAAGLTRLYSLDWVGATQDTKDASIGDYLAVIEQAIADIGQPVNLIGDCQGGWLATIYAALHPDQVNTHTIAGAPIDYHAGQPVIGDYVEAFDRAGGMAFYRWVVARGDGLLKGEYMLNGFIMIKPEQEVEKQLQLLGNLNDPEYVERYRAFEDWFKHTQDIAGAFYLWIVEHLFRDNKLVRGELSIDGWAVDLSEISCPVNLLAGRADHITPPAQVSALGKAVATDAREVVERTTRGGHLGLFMGREALRDHWPPILAGVYAHSRPRARPEMALGRARTTTPAQPAGPAIPTP